MSEKKAQWRLDGIHKTFSKAFLKVDVWCPSCAELHEAEFMVDDQGSYYRTECGLMMFINEEAEC